MTRRVKKKLQQNYHSQRSIEIDNKTIIIAISICSNYNSIEYESGRDWWCTVCAAYSYMDAEYGLREGEIRN